MVKRKSPHSDPAVEALMATSRVLTAVVSRSLTSTGTAVTTPQLRVLVMLSQVEPLNLTAVARALGVNASNASRTCDQLVTGGLVDRRADVTDRRSISLSLTPAGRRLVGRLMTHRRSVFAKVVEHLDEGDCQALSRGLEAFLRAAEALSTGEDEDDDHLLRWLT